ncbi:MAG: MltA domain-containing protein [Bilophila wadsworthia]|uniref:MltA domain-containing protein n=1 Tax=Bilophila wadsworthia TaxID=35833 RepID=UPI00300F4BDB
MGSHRPGLRLHRLLRAGDPGVPRPQGAFPIPYLQIPSGSAQKAPLSHPSRHRLQRRVEGARAGTGVGGNPVDIFMLQIQGSGRLRFEDGSVRSVLYDGQNGHKYVALGRVMVDRGLLKREEVSMFSIREWLAAHPDQVTDLLDTNPSYVFFKLGKPGTSGSKGSMGRRITPWVSVATDQSVLPNGLLTLMNVTLPDEGGEHSVPFNALTLPQDTGGAIKRNRVDLFCGNGETATHTASYLDNRGAVFLLLPR